MVKIIINTDEVKPAPDTYIKTKVLVGNGIISVFDNIAEKIEKLLNEKAEKVMKAIEPVEIPEPVVAVVPPPKPEIIPEVHVKGKRRKYRKAEEITKTFVPVITKRKPKPDEELNFDFGNVQPGFDYFFMEGKVKGNKVKDNE